MYKWKVKPFQHQTDIFMRTKEEKYYAFFHEMGTGKSYLTLMTAYHLWCIGEINCLIILAPNMVHRQWINEQVSLFMPDDIEYETVIYDSHRVNTSSWIGRLNRLHQNKDIFRIIAINIEALQRGKGVKIVERLVKGNDTMLVVDESSRIKSRKASRTKNVINIGGYAKYRRILSGTPITQGVEDLFTQLRFLDVNLSGHKTYASFQGAYCNVFQIPGKRPGIVKITGYRNIDQLTFHIDPHVSRVTKDDCLDLPDKIYITRHIQMTPEQQRLYDNMKENLFVMVEDEMIAAPIVLTQLMKLQQIICGHIRDEDGEVHRLHNHRVEACREILQDTQGKVIIWCRFVPDILMLDEELKEFKRTTVYGNVTGNERDKRIKKFREGDTQVLIAQTDSVGIGLNLMEANTSIYFSNSFRAEARYQSEDRTHRAGQTKHCTYIDLVVPNSIDTYVLKKLQAKKDVADMVYQELRSEI